MVNAVCLLTINPNEIWIDFLSRFTDYDIYIVVDNLKFDTEIYKEKYSNIHFVKITDDDCIQSGYIHSSYMPTSSLKFNEIISWDRALHYFTNVNTDYQHIWFLEDDVFLYNEQTLLNIDKKYQNSDILCKEKNPQPKENEWQWFWPAIQVLFPPPYFHSPICAVRMSKTLLSNINEYVKQSKRLFFIEAMFLSIAYRNNLIYEHCTELDQLYWRRDWKREEFNKDKIFHPIKNIEEHLSIRHYLDKA